MRASQYREIAKRWVSKAIESDRALFELLNIAIQGFTLNLDEERSYWRSFGPIAKAIAECDGRSYASSEMFRGFYYTNIVKCRSQKGGGGDRSPSANNRRNCLPFLAREIAILKPRKIVCLQLRSANDVLSGHIRACVENARHLNTSIVFNDFEIYDFLHLSARGEGMTNAAKKEKTEAAGQMLRRGKFKCRFSNGAWFDGNDYFRAF